MGGEVSYTKTIVEDRPEFLDKPLLLVDSKRERLFRTEDGKYIEVVVSNDGKLAVNEVNQYIQKMSVENMSLRGIGIKFLGFSDPSVPQMLQYLVTPEMEVERILNNMRYKYLKAIYLAGFENPYKYISHEYNKAFQALAGNTVYQGNTSDRKENDDFYRDIGFTDNIRDELKLKIEGDEMTFILHYIRYSEQTDYARIYAELIAIKPGFHELMVHSDYFDESSYPAPDGVRSQVFRLLRGIGGVSDLELDRLPHDINTKSYFTYGSCNVTEGPFVYRKRIDTSYYEEIRKIRSKSDTGELKNSFHVLTYHNLYLFSWNDLIGNDSEGERLLQYLVDYHGTGWTNHAEIHKSDDGKTIRIYTNENSVELTIDDDCGKASLKIDDGRTCYLKVENDHGILYIYHGSIRTRSDLKALLNNARMFRGFL